MEKVLEEVVRRCEAGETVALCTVVAARGSTPQAVGARMVLLGDGRTIGTLGGGCVEAEVRQRALRLLIAGKSELLSFKLDHDYGWDDGLICGGVMDIFVQTMSGREQVSGYRAAVDDLSAGRTATIELLYEVDGSTKKYVETIESAPKLLIVGAGHVGQALGAIASPLGFLVSVLDDRAEVASAERFPLAEKRLVGEIEAELRNYPVDGQTYIVIVTRGHKHDGRALAAVVNSPAKYIGLIGSKRKVKTIFQDLHAQGISLEALLRVHAPIGLEIGSVTVPEIAVSIAAELVAVRRGRGSDAAKPLKFDSSLLKKLLEAGDGGEHSGG